MESSSSLSLWLYPGECFDLRVKKNPRTAMRGFLVALAAELLAHLGLRHDRHNFVGCEFH